ncbi:MAG: thioredoxin domain-containing protein [Planctomycetota bacterium]|jgi:uncharacterized protein YyaL (SSP411 family)
MRVSLLALALAGLGLGGCRQATPRRIQEEQETVVSEKTQTHTAGPRAAAQIKWLQWGPEVFERAKREDKLILFDSGATWCHWCHVMDHVTYEDPEVIRLVNDKFIPVRIDRDRLPDVDAKYQREVPIVRSAAGGWPLTVVITPEGYTLYKATFLPPRKDPRYGAAVGMIQLLEALETYWRDHRTEVAEAGRYLPGYDAAALQGVPATRAQPTEKLIDEIFSGVEAAYDEAHGGFGHAPKFYYSPAVELALARAWAGSERARQIAIKTLESISRGGVCDQIGGGFHRYSVDANWHVPHFEKMAYDNAALLAAYSNAYALSGRHDFARAARETLRWIARVLTAPEGRGFYASQDADVGAGDDGDYFTWTLDEVHDVLGADAEAVISYYSIDSEGDVHGRPGRNVLHVPKTISQLARLLESDEKTLAETIRSARDKLLAARRRRTAPSVDKTLFADLNGMMIDAHLTAYERLAESRAQIAALKALDYLLANLRDERGVFAHYRDGELRSVGGLADQAWMARALIHAYAVTSRPKYLDAVVALADFILAELVAEDGGLLSRPRPATSGPAALAPARRWDDAPSRSAASVAAEVLLDIGYLTGDEKYNEAGSKALASIAGGVSRDWGPFLGGYALGLERLLNGPRTVIIVGSGDLRAAELADTARRAYIPGGLVLTGDASVAEQAALLERLGYPAANEPVAYVCRGNVCLAPAHTPEELQHRIELLKQP